MLAGLVAIAGLGGPAPVRPIHPALVTGAILGVLVLVAWAAERSER